MSLKTSFTTPRLFIADYYDSLINRIDIYTEQLIEQYKEDDLLPDEPDEIEIEFNKDCLDKDELFGEKYHQDPYFYEYNYDQVERHLDVEPGVTKVHDYINQVRAKQIDEIRKVRDHNLEMYEINKLDYKINKSEMNEVEIENLRSRLFADKFSFLVKINSFDYIKQNECIFKQYAVMTDFYMSRSDIDLVKSTTRFFDKTKINFNESNLLISLAKKYIFELVAKQKYGFEVISCNKQSIQNIDKVIINCEYYEYYLIELNLNSDRIGLDMSATTSLYISHTTEVISLDAFPNLKYLSLSHTKLKKSCLNGLNQLKKLKLNWCDLSEIEWESLCFSSLIKLVLQNIINSPSLDLKNLIGLEWLEIDCCGMRLNKIKNLSESLLFLKISNSVSDTKEANEFFANNKMPNLMVLTLKFEYLLEFKKEWILSWLNLKSLSLGFCYLNDFVFLECKSLSNLEDLSLLCDSFSRIKRENFSKLVNLKRLVLSGFKKSMTLSRLFSHLSKLEDLVFKLSFRGYQNSLVIDNEAFFGLTNLISLNLSGNEIKQLDPVAFIHTPKLKDLDLINARLNIDKEFFAHFTNLKKIWISCDFLSKEAVEYIKKHKLMP